MQIPIYGRLAGNANENIKTLVVVFVSAHALKEIKDQVEEAGAEGFTTKPYNLNQIRELVSVVADDLKTVTP